MRGAKKGDAKKKSAPKGSAGSEKTANWPPLPGPKQKKDRGMGVPKIKTSMMEDF